MKIWINVAVWTVLLAVSFRLADVMAMALSLLGWGFMHVMIENVFGDDHF